MASYSSIRHHCELIGAPVRNHNLMPAPTFGGSPHAAGPSYHNNGYGGPQNGGESACSRLWGELWLTIAHSRYNLPPIARPPNVPGPSRPTNGWLNNPNVIATQGSRTPVLQDWKPNPMWKPIKAITNMDSLPDIGHQEPSTVRRDKRFQVALTQDVLDKLAYSK